MGVKVCTGPGGGGWNGGLIYPCWEGTSADAW